MSEADKMFEELGYEKREGETYDVFYSPLNEEGYVESISFDKKRKKIRVFNTVVLLEELKAIYKQCEDLGWI